MTENQSTKNGVTSLSVEGLAKQARATLEEKHSQVVTRRRVGKIFIRTVHSHCKTYQQVCRHYYDQEGKRHLELAKLIWPGEYE